MLQLERGAPKSWSQRTGPQVLPIPQRLLQISLTTFGTSESLCAQVQHYLATASDGAAFNIVSASITAPKKGLDETTTRNVCSSNIGSHVGKSRSNSNFTNQEREETVLSSYIKVFTRVEFKLGPIRCAPLMPTSFHSQLYFDACHRLVE